MWKNHERKYLIICVVNFMFCWVKFGQQNFTENNLLKLLISFVFSII